MRKSACKRSRLIAGLRDMTKSDRFIGDSLKRLKSGRVKSVHQQKLAELAELKLALEDSRFITRVVNTRSVAYAYYEDEAPEFPPRRDAARLEYRPMVPRDTFVFVAGLDEKEVQELVPLICAGLLKGKNFRRKHDFEDGPRAPAFAREML
jgi:hypothetical protein